MNERALPQVLREDVKQRFLAGVHTREPVAGLTHSFYRYPARFSPQFARAAIETFTQPGDLVLDPFMGGATTIVESLALNRNAVGLDINSLSCFVARAKTTPLSANEIGATRKWATATVRSLNMHRPAKRATDWIESGYQRNVSTRQTWPIRKSVEMALSRLHLLDSESSQLFARALVLRTAQWALDCRSDVPSAEQFRRALRTFLDEMIEGLLAFMQATSQGAPDGRPAACLILNRSADGIDLDAAVGKRGTPRLILTSPPYPGVHVMYHRWQILGRRETPAPFWIANSLDGSGLSYYTFGDRNYPGLRTYFETARTVFGSLVRLADSKTLFVQMVAFADAEWQLPAYLDVLRGCGLREATSPQLANRSDGRLWRLVPNRRWYASQRGNRGAGHEVVLFHRLA